MSERVPPAKDNTLFTPGPLTTSVTVKQAMLRDLGSRDYEFIEVVSEIRRGLLELGEVGSDDYTAIPMQGSGTFAIESVFASTVPPDGKVLIAQNGAYGKRMAALCEILKIGHVLAIFPEDQVVDPLVIARHLEEDPGLTHVAVVHCETTTGIMNPVEELGEVVRAAGRIYFVDAMSSFGAVPLNLAKNNIDYLVSSANKCIEGVPGFAFVIARRKAIEAADGYARSLSLDLFAQLEGLDNNGQFRFTPPTHVLLAFRQALRELHDEGGVAGRAERYRNNYEILVRGMRRLGFREYVDPGLQGYIITSFRYPEQESFDFDEFYGRLNTQGWTIYPGKVSDADCFRIGTIGRIFPRDIENLLLAIEDVMGSLKKSL